MEALRFYAPHDARLEDIPEPACGEGEIKIRVKNCSACGTDLKTFRNGHREMTPVTTMGHEIAGEIVEIGRDVVGNWKVGDRVRSPSQRFHAEIATNVQRIGPRCARTRS